MAKIHKKIAPEYFDAVASGKKKFEVRIADFDVKSNDILVLEEWDSKTKSYTGRKLEVDVSYVLKTKDLTFFNQGDIDQYGFQVIQIKRRNE